MSFNYSNNFASGYFIRGNMKTRETMYSSQTLLVDNKNNNQQIHS